MEGTVSTTQDHTPATPEQVVHNCPNCGHWLPDGTLACPDCQTLAYGSFLSEQAAQAQALEREGRISEARDQWANALQWLPDDARQAGSVRQHITTLDARLVAENDRKAKWTKRLGPFAPVALFLLKAKSFLFLLLKFKFLLSLFAYFGIYWALFGWQFAAGLTVSILIHEMGHYVAAKRRGLKVELPFFMPGLGAYVRWFSKGTSLPELAAIALAGPLFGLMAALTSLALYWGTHAQIFLVIANIGAWINVLNLTPVLGLDGAQATYALSRVQRVLVVATCVILFALTASGYDPTGGQHTHYLFLVVAGGMTWRCFTHDIPAEPHTGTLTYYLALFLALGLLLHMTPVMR